MKVAIWLQRHRAFGRRLVAIPFIRDWVGRRVWASFLATPGVREDLAQGRADLAAHRTYVWDMDTGIVSPDPDWPKGGPQPRPPYYFEPTVHEPIEDPDDDIEAEVPDVREDPVPE